MALPKDVNVRAIETPISTPVYTSLLVKYDGREAYGVDVGYYQEDPVESIEAIESQAGEFRECSTDAVASDGCSIQTPSVGQGGFAQVTAFSVITFAYTDVSSFFWYEPEGEIIEEYDEPTVGWLPECPAAEVAVACTPSATRLNPDGSIAA